VPLELPQLVTQVPHLQATLELHLRAILVPLEHRPGPQEPPLQVIRAHQELHLPDILALQELRLQDIPEHLLPRLVDTVLHLRQELQLDTLGIQVFLNNL